MSSPSGVNKKLRGALFLAVGLLVLAIAGVVATEKRAFLVNASRADGVVIALNAGGSHPSVRFSDAAGQTFSFPEGGWIGGYRTGQRVQVLYLRDDPSSSACLDNWGAIWFAPTLLTALGLAHFIAGLVMILRGR